MDRSPFDGGPAIRRGWLGLVLVCCLPVAAITVVLVVAGGVKTGLLVPAITCGAMIGMMVYLTLTEPPRE